MRKAIFAMLAVLGLGVATTALTPVAHATTLFQATQNEGANN